jgi:hypothetical protein
VAHISGHVRIAAPVEQVFDTVADSRNEPSFNPAMTGVELLTPLPIGLGTLGPLSGILGGRMERRIWTGLKDQLEDNGSALSA